MVRHKPVRNALGRFARKAIGVARPVLRATGRQLAKNIGQRLAHRLVASRSKTQQRRPKRTVNPKLSTHSDMHLIKFRIRGPKSRVRYDKNSRVKYTDTYAANVTGNAGQQTVFQGRYVHHLNQLTGALNTTENDRSTWSTSIYFLNPNRLTTGSAALPAVTAPNSEALYCSSQLTTLSISNFENIAAHIEIYWVLAKRDTTAEPSASWEAENVAMAQGQTLFVQPTNDAGVPAAGYPNINLYGQDPTGNPYFHKYWKVLMKKEFILQGGDTARFEYTRSINKLIRKPDLATATAMQPGLTFVPMIVVKPAPVNFFVTLDTSTVARVNTGTTKIGYMQTDTMTYYNIPTKTLPVNRAFSSNINSTFALSTQQFIDDEDDVAMVGQA